MSREIEGAERVEISRASDGSVRVEVIAELCDQGCGERVRYWNDDGLLGGSGNAACGCTVEGPEACDSIMMRPTILALVADAFRGLSRT